MKLIQKTIISAILAPLAASIAIDSPAQAFSLNSSSPLKIMPLGDSNTRGKGVDTAGYRDDLWSLFNKSGYNVDFVGSQITNPPSSWEEAYEFDRDHEGHGGYAIAGETYDGGGELLPNISNWLNAATPDVVMLMAGTNDFIFQNTTAEETRDELGTLIDEIFNGSSDVHLFVSSIPPLAPDRGLSTEASQFNDLIPELLETRYQNNNISFVDTRNLFTEADLYDGIHFTSEGYNKLANAWFESVVAAADSESSPDSDGGGSPTDEEPATVPEPASTLGILVLGALGAGSLRKRDRQVKKG